MKLNWSLDEIERIMIDHDWSRHVTKNKYQSTQYITEGASNGPFREEFVSRIIILLRRFTVTTMVAASNGPFKKECVLHTVQRWNDNATTRGAPYSPKLFWLLLLSWSGNRHSLPFFSHTTTKRSSSAKATQNWEAKLYHIGNRRDHHRGSPLQGMTAYIRGCLIVSLTTKSNVGETEILHKGIIHCENFIPALRVRSALLLHSIHQQRPFVRTAIVKVLW